MGKKTPKAPDFTGIAEQQIAANRADTQWQTNANRPNSRTPWGTSDWNVDPKTGRSTNTVKLDRMDQRTLDNQQAAGSRMSGTGKALAGRLDRDLRKPLNYEGMTEWGELGDPNRRRDAAYEAAYGRSTSRLDPQWDQESNDLEVKLRSQGLVPGDEAYDREMGNYGRAKNDAYSLAMADAEAAGRQESDLMYRQDLGTATYGDTQRQAQIAEMLEKRGWQLGEVQALLGQQVQGPGTPDIIGASNPRSSAMMDGAGEQYQANLDRYNAKQAQKQGLFAGIGSIAGGPIGGAIGGMFGGMV